MREKAVSSWQLYLFGPPRLESNGQPLVIKLRKALALFVYLAVTRQPHSRDALATLFWPELDQQGARANLRRTLYDLTQLLKTAQPVDLLTVEPETIALHADLPLWLDTEIFQQTVNTYLPTAADVSILDQTALAALVQAADLYQDDFLAGFTLPATPAFEEWQFFRRDELRQRYLRLLQQLIYTYNAAGDSERAITFARRWLLLDELEESAHRRLMLLYAEAGQQTAARRQYEECTRILRRELDIDPEPATVALYEEIRLRRLPRATPLPGEEAVAPVNNATDQAAVQPSPVPLAVSHRPHQLPTQATPFIGRAQELQDVIRRLGDPACRLLSLIGPGGIGKTRLAIAVAQQLLGTAAAGAIPPASNAAAPLDPALVQKCAAQFSDGIYFVSLQPITAVAGLIAAIAEVLSFQFYSGEPLHQQLQHFLQDKALLLVLDNFEQLLEEAAFLTEFLTSAPRLKLLVTSRAALKLQEEWFHPLAGLSLPPLNLFSQATSGAPSHAAAGPSWPVENFEHYDAVQLFIQTARRVTVSFDPTQQAQPLIRICRLVDGLPLGVELAASWLKVFTCTEIAEEIERGIDILVARQQNVPERHRNMRVVMTQSLALLDEATQQLLQRLAIFQGGFDQAAARAVAGADLMTLADLVDKAWLYQPDQARYQMHALLRQFVAAQPSADPALMTTVRRAHSAYYLHFLQAHEQALVGKAQLQALEQISLEIENVQMAWRWLLQAQDWAATQQILEGLFWFYLMRRRSVEGADLFTQTLTHLAATMTAQGAAQESPDPTLVAFQLILLRRLGIFHYFLGDYATAQQHLDESLALGRQRADRAAVASALNVLGVINGWQGRGALAQAQLRECLALANEIADGQTAADAYHELAQILAHSGEFAEAKALTAQGLALCRRLERPDWMAHALDTLGWTTFCLGEYAASLAHYRESLAIFQELRHQLGISLALGGLGLNAWAEGADGLGTARRLTEESLAICRTIGNRLHMASHLADLAKILDDLGEHELALASAQEGLAIAEAVGSPLFIAYNLAGLGSALRNLGRLDASRRRLLRALASAAAAQLLPVQIILLYEYAALLQAEGDALVAEPAVRQSKYAQALDLLLLVADHPAGLDVYKRRAGSLRTALLAQLPPSSRAALMGQRGERTLETVVAQLL